MAYYEMMPAGLPAGLQAGMDSVLNKKFGTATTYAPGTWPDTVNLMGPLPIIISNKAPIVSFNDGADDVPVESGTFYIAPAQAGTGTPSPSNPRAISGYTGMTITKTGKNLIDDTDLISGLPSTSIGASINTITASTRYAYVNLPKGGVTLTISSRSDDADYYANILIYGYKDGELYQYTNTAPGTTKTVDFSACDYVRVAIGARTASYQVPLDLTGYGYLQVETGSTATTYSAFASETLAVSWQTEAGTVYGGDLNVTTGVLTVTHVLKEYAVSAMNISDAYPGWRNAGLKALGVATGVYTGILNIGSDYRVNTDSTNDNLILPTNNYNMTQSQWQTDYSNLTVQIIILLATPQAYQLTPHELRTFLGANNFYCDTGDSQLNYRADINLALGGN